MRTIEEVRDEVLLRIREAKSEADDSASLAINSYGAGHDRGEQHALEKLLDFIEERD
ncbi:MAG: hypothetical protein AAFR11_05705 [Pseudomonadota bacterium]